MSKSSHLEGRNLGGVAVGPECHGLPDFDGSGLDPARRDHPDPRDVVDVLDWPVA